MPNEGELLNNIAQAAGAAEEAVRSVLADAGVTLTRPLPAQRSLVIHRLYVRGEKTGTTEGSDGPFEWDVTLGPGAWAVASTINSAGKSTILWALTWPLRGEPDETYERSDTRRWFHYIRLDAEVATVPVSFRLNLQNGTLREAALLTADRTEQLAALPTDAEAGSGVRIVETVDNQDAYAALVSRFMLQRLALPPLHVFSATPGATEEDGARDGSVQTHGWPAYFSVIALASGSDSVLFGRTAFGQLPTRYMQVFLDVPFTAEVMGADVSAKENLQASRHAARRATADAAVRTQQWQPLHDELARAQSRLDSIRSTRPDLPARLREAQESTRALLPLQRQLARAQDAYERARQARIQDERSLRRASESAAARTLFAALDPHSCPRCETDISENRRQREAQQHRCAVCASPLHIESVDDDDRQELLDALQHRLTASRSAENSADSAMKSLKRALSQAEALADQATAAAEHEQGYADYLADLRAAETEVARLKGALEVVSKLGDQTPADDETERILSAAKATLNKIATDATRELFDELNAEIITLARQLGITNLKSVKLDLAGRVNALKSDNTRTTPFRRLGPGERLRLRIAVVVSLIRVGRRHGIHSHPGLLVIDSPADVEIVKGDVQTLFDELRSLGEDEGVQIILATARDEIWETFPADKIFAGADRTHLY
ncbi:hypothetical protein [Actinoplanes aureus]|uniref:Large ATP-binding protein n=1 Tax=Actinoplanes aureus TaxID=2792083 RepID=A0A931CJD8_9ACTN|nr:hypothetical protein [Actinoplanes aureus]MBG0564902.1 hypothetical protein [Actinoplanes aureus]MBG0569087.1 hypothetical protein [Actinoplanes aureus]